MKNTLVAILALIFAIVTTGAYAQEETSDNLTGYRICEWGLAVIQPDDSETTSYIAITNPEKYMGIADTVFTVTGTGQGLFENNVVVQVKDTDGNVLFEQAVIMTTEEIGGEGEWSADIDLGELDSATRVVVEAFSPDPATGMNTALDNVQVNMNSEFGLPFVEITSPVQYANVNSTPIIVEGMAGAAFENNIVVQILDYDDETNILAETFATIQTDELAGSGPWTAAFDLVLDPGTTFNVRAFHPPVADDGDITIDSYGVGVSSSLAQSYEQLLVLKDSDPYVGADDFCELAKAEFENESITPILVNDLTAISTMSMMPLVNVTIEAQKPSLCDLPIRLRVTGEDNNFTGELYYSTAEGEAMCTLDLQPFTAQFSLGTLPSDIYTLTVNDVELE
jgi:hypothetical protein